MEKKTPTIFNILYTVCMDLIVSYFNMCTPSGVVGWLKRLM